MPTQRSDPPSNAKVSRILDEVEKKKRKHIDVTEAERFTRIPSFPHATWTALRDVTPSQDDTSVAAQKMTPMEYTYLSNASLTFIRVHCMRKCTNTNHADSFLPVSL